MGSLLEVGSIFDHRALPPATGMAAAEFVRPSIHGSNIFTSPDILASLLVLPPRKSWITLPANGLSSRLVFSCKPRRVSQQHRLFAAQKSTQTTEEQDEQVKGETTEEEEESDNESSDKDEVQEASPPGVHALINAYKEAISRDDTSRMVTIESQFVALQEERDTLRRQVAALTEEVSTGKERFLRLSADFDNFRKRSERDKLTTTETVKGDVIESLLPMIDNFERAKTQIKVETEAEQRIDNSYQGIYKQFVEIMRGFGVSVVQTIGKEFDPTIHEAIMREESTDFEEDIVVQEFRRGFMLNGRLLRPAMVKVSAGSGKAASVDSSEVPSEAITVNSSEAPSHAPAVDSSEAVDVAESEMKQVS